MKKTIISILAIFLTVFALLAVLSAMSTGLIEKHALPAAEELLGVPVRLESAKLNFLSGTFTAADLSVRNPRGFEESDFITADKVSVKIALLPLLRGRIIVSRFSLDNFTMQIIRNTQGAINANHFAARLQTDNTGTSETTQEPAGKAPQFKITDLDAAIRLRYIDHALTTNKLDYAFKTIIKVKNIKNFGKTDEYGTFSANSHLENNPLVLNSSITGKIATLANPAEPTFEINGTIKSIHVDELNALADIIGIYSKEFTVETPLKSTDGRLKGNLKITFHEPTATGSLAKKISQTKLPKVVTVTVPVKGTVQSPEADLTGAILQSLVDNVLGNLDQILKTDSGDIQEKIDGAVDGLKDLFKKKRK